MADAIETFFAGFRPHEVHAAFLVAVPLLAAVLWLHLRAMRNWSW